MFKFVAVLTVVLFSFSEISQNAATELVHKNGFQKSEMPKKDAHRRYETHTECGGVVDVLKDNVVVIEYKLNEEYSNNEMCIWTLKNIEANNLLITKYFSGFEAGYDYLQSSAFTCCAWDNPMITDLMGKTDGIEQSTLTDCDVGYLIFSSDSSNTGTGFRVEIIGYRERYFHYKEDHWVSNLPSGSYSLRPYRTDMMSSWTIAINKQEAINMLQMMINYSAGPPRGDELAIYQLERNGQSINFKLIEKISGVGIKCYEAHYYTNFLVVFYTDRNTSNDGEGVTLQWVGLNSNDTLKMCDQTMTKHSL